MEAARRRRVILEGVVEPHEWIDPPHEIVSSAALRALADTTPDAALSYGWQAGNEIALGITLSAPNEETALLVAAGGFLTVIPHPPETTVTRFTAYPLKAEPDFI